MNIEELVKKYERLIPASAYTLSEGIRAALTEQAETHAIELRAYEATVQNLVEALRGVIRVADRDTVGFDAAKAAIFNAMGDHHA